MPIYEYRCAQCGQKKEFLQKMDDQPISQCPECGSTQFQKCLSSATVQLKEIPRQKGAVPPCQLTGQCTGCGCEG